MEAAVANFALTLTRVGAFLYAAPLIGGPNIPRTVKVGLSFALAVFFTSYNPAAEGDSGLTFHWLSLGLGLARETLLGGVFGLAFSVMMMPARIAGEFIAQESGLTFANVVGASGDGSTNPISVLMELLAGMVFFASDLHHVFLMALRATFDAYPAGRLVSLPDWDLVTIASKAQEGGLLLALPVAVCLFLTTVVLSLMTRAAPQLNMYSVGFPMRVIVSLGAVLLLLPTMLGGIRNLMYFFLDLLQLRS